MYINIGGGGNVSNILIYMYDGMELRSLLILAGGSTPVVIGIGVTNILYMAGS